MSPPSSRPFLTVVGLWFVLACIAGLTGRVAAMTPPLPQVMIGAMTLALILSGAFHPGLHAWLTQVNLRGFVAFHLTRYVGIAFLIMYGRGQLSGEFALTAGWGDILAATGALAIVVFLRDPMSKPTLFALWNALGLADILLVVVTATRIALRSPAEIRALLVFPMSLVPTFVVPLLIASHVLAIWRLRRLRVSPA
jgi:hypothetical protein